MAGFSITAASANETADFDSQVLPILTHYCVQCHGPETQEAKLRLDNIKPVWNANGSDVWRQIIRRVEIGQMPPESNLRPTPDEIQFLTRWVQTEENHAELGRRETEGRVVLRRLNRNEYQNTIRDLLGIDTDLREQLPQDGSANGFDNASAAMHTSSFLMERYLEAADVALGQAIVNKARPPKSRQQRYSLTESRPVNTTTERVYKILDSTVVCFCSSLWHNVFLSNFHADEGGNYRFRISASGYQSLGKPVTYRVTSGGTRLTGKTGLIGYFDAPADSSNVTEFVRYIEPKTTISILPYGLPSAQTVRAIGSDAYEGPGLAIHWIEVEGPLHDSWPPESHRLLFGELAQASSGRIKLRDGVEVVSDQPKVDAQRILRDFTQRAFRRAVRDEDVRPFLQIVDEKLASNYTFEQAVRAALKGVLVSPDFLFLRETPGKLNDHALASRLSYFLWSTMPDDVLLQLADEAKLGNDSELYRQVERMLEDKRATAFTENFVGQWLGLRDIDATEPSHILYPEFDHMLKVSMIQEAELFFSEILRDNLSVANFAASEFTMLNGRLAKHYGVPGIYGWEFQKVQLPPDSHRGGILTMAGVLKVTANGTTTSPVMRGAWVLDKLLGTPPAPPPENIPTIDPDIRGATTIREQLEKHRSSAACMGCHSKIDPPGFALESFDCIGGWRDFYRVTGNGGGMVVDSQRVRYRNGKKSIPHQRLAMAGRLKTLTNSKGCCFPT